MLNYIWPIALVLVSNTFYQICTKGVPESVSPFASLTVTYAVGMVVAAVMHYATYRSSIVKEIANVNWTSYILGVVIVGLEVGWIYAYKAGWQVSTGNIVSSALLAVILIFVGLFLYKEQISWNKIVGITICLVGLVFINVKN